MIAVCLSPSMPFSFNRQKQASMRRGCVTVHICLMTIASVTTVMSLASMMLSGRSENLALTPTQPLSKQSSTSRIRDALTCHIEEHAEYGADTVVVWGSWNVQESVEDCCNSCFKTAGCNVWVFCPSTSGCGQDRAMGECWLKTNHDLDSDMPGGHRGQDVPWTSGVALSSNERQSLLARREQQAATEAERLTALRSNTSMPLVFLDVSIKGQPQGRMEFVLFTAEAPRAAENFRQLCTAEAGIVPSGRHGAGKPYHFKGSYFYRIIHKFIDQSGVEIESVFGGQFDDDAGGLALKHDRFGLLSMANSGPNTNTAHFSIVIAPAPHLDGHYTIFGELVSGEDVALAINNVSLGKPNQTAGVEEEVLITDSGQIR
eukprot:jgi/Ulvmu1/10544/UM064_0082.1